MTPILVFLLLVGVQLGATITNNNNNFGSGDHTNNNNNNIGDYYDDDDDDDDDSDAVYRKDQYRHKYRPTHSHSYDVVNNNGGSLSKSVGKKCPHGKIVNNNGPGNVQVVCLPKGVPSQINNNG